LYIDPFTIGTTSHWPISINGIQIFVFDIMFSKDGEAGKNSTMSLKLSTTIWKPLFFIN